MQIGVNPRTRDRVTSAFSQVRIEPSGGLGNKIPRVQITMKTVVIAINFLLWLLPSVGDFSMPLPKFQPQVLHRNLMLVNMLEAPYLALSWWGNMTQASRNLIKVISMECQMWYIYIIHEQWACMREFSKFCHIADYHVPQIISLAWSHIIPSEQVETKETRKQYSDFCHESPLCV